MAESKGFLMSIVHGRRCAATFLYQYIQCLKGVLQAGEILLPLHDNDNLQTRPEAFIFKQDVVVCSPTRIDACTS